MTYGKVLRTLIIGIVATIASTKLVNAQTIAPSNIQLPSSGTLCWASGTGNCDSSISRDSTGGSGVFDFGTGAPNSTNGTINVGNVSLNLLTAHGVLVSEGASTLIGLFGTTGQCLTSTGPSSDPSFQTCNSATLQTGGVNNSSQTVLNFQNGNTVNGLQIQPSNPSGGNEQMNLSGLLTVAGGGTGLNTLSAHRLYAGNGASVPNSIATGNAGQVLISNGGSSDPTFQDPIISEAYVTPFSAVSITGPQTSLAIRVPTFNLNGTWYYTFAGVTGAYNTCTLAVKPGDSLGNIGSTNIWSVGFNPPTNQTATQFAFNLANGNMFGDTIQASWSCVGYGTGGTLTLDFAPASVSSTSTFAASSVLADAISNTQWLMLNAGSNNPIINETFPMLFNGTTWDRTRSANTGNNVAANGIAANALYGQFNTAPISTMSSGNYGALQTDARSNLSIGSQYVNLINAGAATGTITSGLFRIPNFNTAGTVYFTFSGLTGVYTSCTVTLKYADSLGNLSTTTSLSFSGTPTNGTFNQKISNSVIGTAAQTQAVWACAAYGTGGTISVDFVPATNGEDITTSSAVDALSNSNVFPLRANNEVIQKIYPYLFNGATWDRQRSSGATTGALLIGQATSGFTLADTIGNAPQTPVSSNGNQEYVPSMTWLFNGTTWDRARSASIGNNVAGNGIAAHALYGQYNTNPQSILVTSGNYGTLQIDPNGRLLTAQSPPIIIQKATASNSSAGPSQTANFPANTQKGNTIVVVFANGNTNNPASPITDGNGDIFTKANQIAQGAFEVGIWYATNIAGGSASVTVTPGGTNASIAMEIYEINGLVTFSPTVLDTINSSFATSSGPIANQLLSTVSNEYVFNGIGVGTAVQTITNTAGGMNNDSGQVNPTSPSGLFSFASFSAGITNVLFSPTFSLASSEPWISVIAGFKAANSVPYGLPNGAVTFADASSNSPFQFIGGSNTNLPQPIVLSTYGYVFNGTTWDRLREGREVGSTVSSISAAAFALTDAASNSEVVPTNSSNTAIFNPSLGLIFNGSTWDRQRSAGIGNNVASTGLTAHALYGQFNTAPIAAVSTGNYAALQTDNHGNISVGNQYVNLFNVVATTGTQTGSLFRIPNFSSGGTVFYTFAGITGVYTSCTITLKYADSLGNIASTSQIVFSGVPANGTNTANSNVVATVIGAAQIEAVWACSAYGSGGTLSVDWLPAATAITVAPAIAFGDADALSNSQSGFSTIGATEVFHKTMGHLFNGTTWDRQRGAVGTVGVTAVNTEGTKATYHLSGFVTPGAAPTDVINLQGSGTKTIRILHIEIYPVATAAGTVDVQLVRRSTANTGGTSSAPTIGKNDTSDAAATLAQLVYTANPTALGTTVANLGACRTSIVTSGALAPCMFDYTTRNDKGLRLSGTSEFLSINGNGATLLTGETWGYDIEWSEE